MFVYQKSREDMKEESCIKPHEDLINFHAEKGEEEAFSQSN